MHQISNLKPKNCAKLMKAKEKNEEFLAEYVKVVNKFTKQFMDEFCSSDGSKILWDKIVKLNSGVESIKNRNKSI
ncbi:MAG: hypothetical protein DYG83_00805 [Candidatus Brocadia sp. AMX2]|nr:MAG: hypothetical protein EDM70_01935 [Candidatus Brocadia sp. AMX2]MBC6930690.1 hypothetical protein [Candidatus Brocadia sp.]MBL1167253.1 hypothetical protein [Candidatus Brocadia sp. AMX1]MCE7865365.1 hypothetical protein [Candidatus Brocadia sp. AMX2]MCQ3915949.1 hypothetical protein [Candidatus Brocadia sp.]